METDLNKSVNNVYNVVMETCVNSITIGNEDENIINIETSKVESFVNTVENDKR